MRKASQMHSASANLLLERGSRSRNHSYLHRQLGDVRFGQCLRCRVQLPQASVVHQLQGVALPVAVVVHQVPCLCFQVEELLIPIVIIDLVFALDGPQLNISTLRCSAVLDSP